MRCIRKTSIEKVQRDWDNYVAHADREEGCGGLGKKIRWLEDHICDSQEEAEEYIKREDRGWYDQLAVRFRTVLLRQERAEIMARERQDKLDAEIAKESKKNGNIKWLVKIEYHT